MLIYTFMELLAGISLAAIEQWGFFEKTVGGGKMVIFPVHFAEQCFVVLASEASPNDISPLTINNIITTHDYTRESATFTSSGGTSGVHWLASGH